MPGRAEKLKNIAMPKKPMAEQEAELDLEGFEEDMDEMPEGAEMAEAGSGGMFDEYSDEELIEEMIARGLMDSEEEPEEDLEEMPEEEDEEMLGAELV